MPWPLGLVQQPESNPVYSRGFFLIRVDKGVLIRFLSFSVKATCSKWLNKSMFCQYHERWSYEPNSQSYVTATWYYGSCFSLTCSFTAAAGIALREVTSPTVTSGWWVLVNHRMIQDSFNTGKIRCLFFESQVLFTTRRSVTASAEVLSDSITLCFRDLFSIHEEQ